MFSFIFKRLIGLLGTLLLLSALTFLLMHSIPGGPYSARAEIPLSEGQIATFKRLYGLDRPLWEQYWKFLRNAVRLDFGYSFQSPGETCLQIVARTWPTSIHLGLMASALAIVAGVGLGFLAAYHQNTWVDYSATLVSTLTITTPNFVLGILMMYLFSVRLRWLPTGGWTGPKTWIMPVVAMGMGSIGGLTRLTRGVLLDVMRADYVRTARGKGLTEFQIAFRHVLRNASIPLITAILPIIPGLITGTVFVENLFRVAGLGKWFTYSSFKRDYPMILTVTLLYAALIALTYLLNDVLYAIIDPRVRLGERAE